MIQIETIELGLPKQNGTQILITPKIANTQDKTCLLDWRILSEDFKDLATGTIQLTEKQYEGWGGDNTYVEDIVLNELELVRI